jgi:hypothetical protein
MFAQQQVNLRFLNENAVNDEIKTKIASWKIPDLSYHSFFSEIKHFLQKDAEEKLRNGLKSFRK